MKKNNILVLSILAMLVLSLLVSQLIHKIVRAQISSDLIPDQYIVVMKDSVVDPEALANEHAKAYGLSISYTYKNAIKGYSATIPLARLEKIKKDPRIEFISQDREVSVFAPKVSRPIKSTPTPTPVQIQETPTGVKRIGISTDGEMGVGVAVIDTGIDLSHPDLNVVASKTCVLRTRSANDDNGHGSHVAGTIAALNNDFGVVGVAPQASLVAVKVLDRNGSGSWSSVICGIDWVTANAADLKIKVANMSLGGGGSSDDACGSVNNDALHKAICDSTAKGVTYVVAAGNEGTNASNSVPASYDDTVITVSALADSDGIPGGEGLATSYGADDTFAIFSNYGNVVDLGAPGVSIYSTWKSGGYNTISGTSMATPHVAGVAALYHMKYPEAKWDNVRDELVSKGEIADYGHTNEDGLHPEPIVLTTGF